MAGVYDAIRVFVLEHRGWGNLLGNAEPITPDWLQGLGALLLWGEA